MPLGLRGEAAGWVARGEARTRDNEKSRTGSLGVADIDEYLARGGNRRSMAKNTEMDLTMCRPPALNLFLGCGFLS